MDVVEVSNFDAARDGRIHQLRETCWQQSLPTELDQVYSVNLEDRPLICFGEDLSSYVYAVGWW